MHLKRKSEINFECGATLEGMGKYAPSVHCFYYSCFQLSKKFLLDCVGMDYAEQDRISKGKDSHKVIIEETMRVVNRPAEFNRLFRHLRFLRKKTDYQNAPIHRQDSTNAHEYAEKIIRIINASLT